jgi:hypothetical protein
MKLTAWRMIGVLLVFLSAAPANAVEVSREDWMNGMTTALPAYFCKADQYFRQCFDVTQVECEETALSTTRVCLAKNKSKIPARLKQPEDGTRWGTVIGSCAGSNYEIVLQKKRINNKKCNDPNAWT